MGSICYSSLRKCFDYKPCCPDEDCSEWKTNNFAYYQSSRIAYHESLGCSRSDAYNKALMDRTATEKKAKKDKIEKRTNSTCSLHFI